MCSPSLPSPGATVTGLQHHPPTRLFLPLSHAIHESPWSQLPGLTNRSRSPPRHFPPLFSCRSELMPSATPSDAIAAAGAPSRLSSPVKPSSKSPLVAASPRISPSYSASRVPKPELRPSHHRCSWRLAAVERHPSPCRRPPLAMPELPESCSPVSCYRFPPTGLSVPSHLTGVELVAAVLHPAAKPSLIPPLAHCH
jgi:hypothetical protein